MMLNGNWELNLIRLSISLTSIILSNILRNLLIRDIFDCVSVIIGYIAEATLDLTKLC